MNKCNILVSIIIPVYNVEAYIKKCLDSVCEQTHKNIEIIVVNDGSEDNSLKILKEYEAKDSRILVIDQENQGLSGARNSALHIVKGEYVIFVDSDDFIEDNLIEDCLSLSKKNDTDIIVYGYKKVDKNMQLISQPDYGNNIFTKEDGLKKIVSLSISPMACNKFIKTKLFQENKVLFPVGKLHEDIGTIYQLFFYAKSIGTTSKSYYYWMNREDSITATITFKHMNHLVELLAMKKQFLKQKLIWNKYDIDYNIGVLKIINLILERSLNTSKSLVEYALFVLNHNMLLSEEEIEILEEVDSKQTRKYKKLKEEAEVFVSNKDISLSEFYTLQKKNRYLTQELEHLKSSKIYQIVYKLSRLNLKILPLGSRRRSLAKKLLKRK